VRVAHQIAANPSQVNNKAIVQGKTVQITKAQHNRYELYMKNRQLRQFQTRTQVSPSETSESSSLETNVGKKRHVVSRKSNKANRNFAGQYIISFEKNINPKASVRLKNETVSRRTGKNGDKQVQIAPMQAQVQAQQVRSLAAHQANQQVATTKPLPITVPVSAVTLNVSSSSQQKPMLVTGGVAPLAYTQPQMIIQQQQLYKQRHTSQQQNRQLISSKQGKTVYANVAASQQLISGTREVKMSPGVSTQMIQAQVQLTQARQRRVNPTASPACKIVSNPTQTLTVAKLVHTNPSGSNPRQSLVSQVPLLFISSFF